MKKFGFYFFAMLICVASLFGFNTFYNSPKSPVLAEEETLSELEIVVRDIEGEWAEGEVSAETQTFYENITNNLGTGKPFTVDTPDKLAAIVLCLKNNKELPGEEFLITKTIDMGKHVWSGINSSFSTFKGTITLQNNSFVKNLVYTNGPDEYLIIELTDKTSDLISKPAMSGNWASFTSDQNGIPVTSLSGSGTETHPYEITSAAELAYVAKTSFEGNWYLETHFEIRENIDLAGHVWQLLDTETAPFMGTITIKESTNNNSYTPEILNLYIRETLTFTKTIPNEDPEIPAEVVTKSYNVIHKLANPNEISLINEGYFNDGAYITNVHTTEDEFIHDKILESVYTYDPKEDYEIDPSKMPDRTLGTAQDPILISNIYQLVFFKDIINGHIPTYLADPENTTSVLEPPKTPGVVDPEEGEEEIILAEFVNLKSGFKTATRNLNMLAPGLTFRTAHYKLAETIDLKGKMWEPIGTLEYPFMGTFDGNGFELKNILLYYNVYEENATEDADGNTCSYGTFGYLENATITNLGLENVQVRISPSSTNTSSKRFNLGILAGHSQGSNISYSKVAGSINANTFATMDIGGFVGTIIGTEIRDSYSNVNITAIQSSVNPISSIGGIAGLMTDSSIYTVFSQGNITLNKKLENAKFNAGGLIGFLTGTQSEIHNCFTTSNITLSGAKTNVVLGGIVGKIIENASLAPTSKQINYCYYVSNNQTSSTVETAIGASPTLYPYTLVRLTTSPTSADFFSNDEEETKWLGLYEWDLQDTWAFNEITYIPNLQLFSDYTITLYCEDPEKYDIYFLDENNVPIVDEHGITIKTYNYRIGEKVKIVAEFKPIQDEDVGIHYGKYYMFKNWKHAGSTIPTSVKYYRDDYITEEPLESEYIRTIYTIDSFTSTQKGLYSIETQARQVKIHIVLEGQGSFEYDAETVKNETEGAPITRTFFTTYDANVRIKAVKLADKTNWTFENWYFAERSTSDFLDLSLAASKQFSTRTTLTFKVGELPIEDTIRSPEIIIGTKDPSIEDEGNGFELGSLNIVLKCVFTSKPVKVSCTVKEGGEFKFEDLHAANNEGLYILNEGDTKSNIDSAVGKRVKLTAIAKEGYVFKAWYVNGEEQSSDMEYIYTLTDPAKGFSQLTIEARFEVDSEFKKGPDTVLILLISIGGGLSLIAIIVIVIIMVRKKKNAGAPAKGKK